MQVFPALLPPDWWMELCRCAQVFLTGQVSDLFQQKPAEMFVSLNSVRQIPRGKLSKKQSPKNRWVQTSGGGGGVRRVRDQGRPSRGPEWPTWVWWDENSFWEVERVFFRHILKTGVVLFVCDQTWRRLLSHCQCLSTWQVNHRSSRPKLAVFFQSLMSFHLSCASPVSIPPSVYRWSTPPPSPLVPQPPHCKYSVQLQLL